MQLKIRPTKIKFYIKFMQSHGFQSDCLLAGSDLDVKTLENPSTLIDISKYIRIVCNMQYLYQSPSLAFDLGKSLTIGDLGIFGYTLLSCENTYVSNKIYLKYSSLFFGNLIDVKIVKKKGQIKSVYSPNIDSEISPSLLQFLIEERINMDFALYRLHGLNEELFPCESISFTFPAPHPATIQLFKELIDVPLYFSRPQNIFVLKKHSLSMPFHGFDKETHQHCLKLLIDIYENFHSHDKYINRVKNILYSDLSRAPNIDYVAKKMFFSKRTLNRKLNAEGATFADLVADTRLDAIVTYAVTTDLSQKDISDKLGFSDVSSMRRFFKSKAGKTISDYKNDIISNRSAVPSTG